MSAFMDIPEVRSFILHWGEMGTQWGVNRSVAQMHALLYLSDRPLHAEEICTHPAGPLALVMENARLKGAEVARKYPDRWVLGADTLVWIDDEVLGKPKDMEEATTMLRGLAGRTHSVSTGLCLSRLCVEYEETRVETSEVTFQAFDDSVIEAYFEEVDPFRLLGTDKTNAVIKFNCVVRQAGVKAGD